MPPLPAALRHSWRLSNLPARLPAPPQVCGPQRVLQAQLHVSRQLAGLWG